ncbi:bifunctional hydroxymethylpyrimidine kinase/phosphomethylpyrimidine kinase [Lachnospiraceae bacterium LCP25S3_G4]
MKTALTIAGSDCSGGAGIQADIKTMTAHGVYAMSAITALTAQNTMGVYGIMEVEPIFLKNQLDCIFTDIFPDAIKIGMVGNSELIHIIAQELRKQEATNVVLDPVMVATSGGKLLEDHAIDVLCSELMPLATVITPNIREAEILSRTSINNEDDMVTAARILSRIYHGSILIKGGHQRYTANDLLYNQEGMEWFQGVRIDNFNTHGTGCTLSSAIASNLALGMKLSESIKTAKAYISGALLTKLDLGQGSGPLNHMFRWQ